MSVNDIKENKHYFILIIIYGIILGIIYSYWMYKSDIALGFDILVLILFILCGVLCAFLSTLYEMKKKKQEINTKSEEINLEQEIKQ